ncbi:hypothetical protein GGI04_005560, partial [Coemansia thaxteri]
AEGGALEAGPLKPRLLPRRGSAPRQQRPRPHPAKCPPSPLTTTTTTTTMVPRARLAASPCASAR